jgi:pimeloyl-ACP methyl ester carboxylesterase
MYMPRRTLDRPPSRFVEVDGRPVHWVDFGAPEGNLKAPLAVCVHGLGGSWVNWMALAPLLTSRYHVVAFDLAGFGLTPLNGRRADIRSNRRLLDAFLRTIADRPVTLIGNSMGGLLSILQASRHPETVERLVLLDAAVPLPRSRIPNDPRFIATFLTLAAPVAGEQILRRRSRRSTPADLVGESLNLVCHDPSRVSPALIRESEALAATRSGDPNTEKAFLAAARSIAGVLARPGRYIDAIMAVEQPTLLIFGAHDRLIPVSAGRALAKRRPDWAFVVNDDLGHVPQIEDPAWTAQQILSWASSRS